MLGTAASAVAPYVAITVGVVTAFVVLDNRSVTVIGAPPQYVGKIPR